MVEVEHLTKWFGTKLAVDDVSFSVKKGEVLGFLGPNGAGKSTSMRMITGFLHPDDGVVTIGGYKMDDEPIRAKSVIGYLPENAPAYGDMTVDAFLGFVATLRGLHGRKRNEAISEVIETCFLQPVRYQPIDTLSKGYLHRTCFAQSILHDPDVLILDEPTDGLDPNQKHEVRNLIKRMGERKAIILSTHILEEVDAVCSRVIVIDNGKLVANGLPAELKERSALAGVVLVTFRGLKFAAVGATLEQVSGVDKVLCVNDSDDTCTVRVVPKKEERSGLAARVYDVIKGKGWDLSELHTEEGRLDDVFRDITHFVGGKS